MSELGVGLRCPECGKVVRHASVKDTRRGRDFIRRRRLCKNGHAFTTRETVWVHQPKAEPTPRERLLVALDEYMAAAVSLAR